MEAQIAPPSLPALATAHRHGDDRRAWSEAFVVYAYSIAADPAYAGMPCTVDDDGKVDWTIPSGRAPGAKNWDGNRRRKVWWEEKAREIGEPVEGKWISRVARKIHPWGWKPCQTCGRWMRLSYAYPTVRTLARINAYLQGTEHLEVADRLDIYEVAEHLIDSLGEDEAALALQEALPGMGNLIGLDLLAIHQKLEDVVRKEPKGTLSPGAMSNAPDRLDGFHTYNLCCRERQDTGRYPDNLKSYGVDRRAFEYWSEGDWQAANALMSRVTSGPCLRCGEVRKLTADHLGPISLGFQHTAYFEAVCGSCNSARNNRMSSSDVRRLKDLENGSSRLVSWHAAPLWDVVRDRVHDDAGSLRLSKLMSVNQHEFLRILQHARTSGIPDALVQFLSPEYAENRVDFVGLDCATLRYERIERSPRQSTYVRTKAARLLKIAFEALDDCARKAKRNVQVIPHQLVVEAAEGVDLAIERAVDDPSAWREPLLIALDTVDPALVREGRLQELIGQGQYGPNHDYRYVRVAFEQYMSRVAEVLADRFEDDRAIKLWDDALSQARI